MPITLIFCCCHTVTNSIQAPLVTEGVGAPAVLVCRAGHISCDPCAIHKIMNQMEGSDVLISDSSVRQLCPRALCGDSH